MASSERDDLRRPAVEKRVALDQQRPRVLLDQSCERIVEITVVAGIDDENLLPCRAGSVLNTESQLCC